MKKTKLFLVVLTSLWLISAIMLNHAPERLAGHASAAEDSCPAGTYELGPDKITGEPVCKADPTGCPYGDSIPIDECSKFAPAIDPVDIGVGK